MKINVSFLAALLLVGTDLVAVTAGLRGKKLALSTISMISKASPKKI